MSEEQYCRQMLADLKRAFDRDAKPYIDRLVAIKSMELAPSIVLPMDQAQELMEKIKAAGGPLVAWSPQQR